ncbi:hypothetical protein DFH09DRAFT_1113491 [Mycena vulgaris]|nr:hypothetical protein DFH09DRAFT_1113491 [Mycena vulgaris]
MYSGSSYLNMTQESTGGVDILMAGAQRAGQSGFECTRVTKQQRHAARWAAQQVTGSRQQAGGGGIDDEEQRCTVADTAMAALTAPTACSEVSGNPIGILPKRDASQSGHTWSPSGPQLPSHLGRSSGTVLPAGATAIHFCERRYKWSLYMGSRKQFPNTGPELHSCGTRNAEGLEFKYLIIIHGEEGDTGEGVSSSSDPQTPSDAKNILAVEDPGDDGDLPVAKTTSPLRYFRRDNLLDGFVVVFDGTCGFPKRIAYIINLVAYYDSAVTTGLELRIFVSQHFN